jgi:hypothetical protein
MRNKKVFSFDEEKDAAKIITNGFPNGSINYSDMYLIAKYFRKTFDYGAVRLERELIRFCQGQDKNFNPVTEAEAIKKWVRSAMNYDLHRIESITISQSEIDFLKSVDVQKDRKLLFMTLVLSKALKKRAPKRNRKLHKPSEHYYIHYNNFLDIIRLSKVKNISETDLAHIYFKYKEYFTFYTAEKELLRIDFIDKDPHNGIVIDRLEEVLDYYEVFFGKNPSEISHRCLSCNKLIKKSNNHQKYCEECSKRVRKEKQRKLMQIRRSL